MVYSPTCWLIFMANVGKHTSPMDPMGTENFGSKGSRPQVEGLNSRIVGRMIRAAAFYKFLRGPKDIVPIQHLGGLSGAQVSASSCKLLVKASLAARS